MGSRLEEEMSGGPVGTGLRLSADVAWLDRDV